VIKHKSKIAKLRATTATHMRGFALRCIFLILHFSFLAYSVPYIAYSNPGNYAMIPCIFHSLYFHSNLTNVRWTVRRCRRRTIQWRYSAVNTCRPTARTKYHPPSSVSQTYNLRHHAHSLQRPNTQPNYPTV